MSAEAIALMLQSLSGLQRSDRYFSYEQRFAVVYEQFDDSLYGRSDGTGEAFLGQLYFNPVDTWYAPIGEAGYLARESSISVGFNASQAHTPRLRTPGPDGITVRLPKSYTASGWQGGIEYYPHFAPLYAAYTVERSTFAPTASMSDRIVSSHTLDHTLTLGVTPAEGWRVGTRLYAGDDVRQSINLNGKYVHMFTEQALNLEWEFHYRSGQQILQVGGDWYFNHSFSVGIALDREQWEAAEQSPDSATYLALRTEKYLSWGSFYGSVRRQVRDDHNELNRLELGFSIRF